MSLKVLNLILNYKNIRNLFYIHYNKKQLKERKNLYEIITKVQFMLKLKLLFSRLLLLKLLFERKNFIFKILALSNVVFQVIMIASPNLIIKDLPKIRKGFLWKKVKAKSKHYALCNGYKQDTLEI